MIFDLSKPIGLTHIELTDKCNAICPQCTRTNPNIIQPYSEMGSHELTLEDFENRIPDSLYKQTKLWKFCGTHGDPLVARDCLEIVKHIRDRGSDSKILISTNGSFRTRDWWSKLAEIPNVQVWFGIDGNDNETHTYYRIGTNLEKILENAQAYIESGGSAYWQTIAFKHNEHQIEQMRIRSKQMGFEKFLLVKSTRYTGLENFANEYSYKDKYIKLEQPTNPDYIHGIVQQEPGKIICKFHERNAVYIGSSGHVQNCCHTGASVHKYVVGLKSNTNFIFEQIDMDLLDFRKTPFEEIPKREQLFDMLKKHWPEHMPKTCKIKCSGMINKRDVEED